ncbi:hypothetical protein DFH07DRAFT_562083 [Mycena maculata]|uniref:LysM domain-containing protein n=1 Tax=Mycena maculata TaxID=230809 RepID=A0AAD7IR24_9AGAR|nr:hypothetical protein DFH07DRAFT_562083 [Mycena maculata]
MMVLRLSFYVLSVLLISANAAPLRRANEPDLPHRRAPASYRQYTKRQSHEIDALIGNITGKTVSNSAGLAQTLGSLFGGANSSSTAITPSTSVSDSQITGNASVPTLTSPDDPSSPTMTDSSTPGNATLPSGSSGTGSDDSGTGSDDSGTSSDDSGPSSVPIVSQSPSLTTSPAPTGVAGGGSDSDNAFSLLSELMGGIPTSLPSVPSLPTGDGSPWPSGGSDSPQDGPEQGSYGQSGTGSQQGGDGGAGSWSGGSGGGSWPSGGSDDPQDGPEGPYGQSGTGSQQIPDCAETYRAVSGDTCAAISGVFDLSAADFLRMNPTIGAGCTNLEVGQEYCVQKGSSDGDEGEDDDEDDGEDDGDDEDEGDDDEYGLYGPVIVHVHNHAGGGHCSQCEGSGSDSGYGQAGSDSPPSIPTGVPGPAQSGYYSPPLMPSAPISSVPSDLPIPLPPTLPTGLNSTDSTPALPRPTGSTGFNSTDSSTGPNSTDSSTGSSSTGFNSTDSSTSFNSTASSTAFSSTGFNSTESSTGSSSTGSSTGFDSTVSMPALPLPTPPSLNLTDSNSTTGLLNDTSSASQPTPSGTLDQESSDGSGMDSRASGSPRKISVTWEEDF